jgi:hypothetical protein
VSIVPADAYGAGVSPQASTFDVVEATISDIQQALLSGQLTTTQLVQLYLDRIKGL